MRQEALLNCTAATIVVMSAVMLPPVVPEPWGDRKLVMAALEHNVRLAVRVIIGKSDKRPVEPLSCLSTTRGANPEHIPV